jgi:hypothetical protein
VSLKADSQERSITAIAVSDAGKKLLFFLAESSGSIWHRHWKLLLPTPLRLQEWRPKGELSVISVKPSKF